MNNDKLEDIYASVSDSIQGQKGAWQFFVKDIQLVSFTDTEHNRMRIISPIANANTLDGDLIKAALVANFHTALDVKYAVSEGVLWAVFIHPLQELSSNQVKDAVSQVYYANINFGTSFASTSLSFPWIREEVKETEQKKKRSGSKKRKI
ncbi:hypothetical protein A9Q86_07515 [Flavobacteriales bacterium 33_180_T64]|nr:hypothetical protein A9Q86_07515 [Flavobacteriales bacterium 33_180_T64]